MKKSLPALLVALTCAAALSCGSRSHSAATDSATGAAQSDSEQPAPASAMLLFVGDAMTHQAQLDRARQLASSPGMYDFSDCFRLIAPDVTEADYAVVNLETPLGGGRGGYTGYPCFSAPDSYAVALRKAGFDLMLTANNHTLDRGDSGLRRTIHTLDSLGIAHTGTYLDDADRDRKTPFIATVNGIRIAFLNYTYGTNGITPRAGAVAALIDTARMARDIDDARRAGAEMIAVCPHWGVEYQLREHPSQRALTQFLLRRDVDMIIGTHPHVVQPMQMLSAPSGKQVPVVYSLGNFLSNMKTDDTRGGALARVYVSRSADGSCKVDSATWDIFYAAKPDPAAPAGSALRNFTVVPSRMAPDSIPPAQRDWWTTFSNRSCRLFNDANVGIPRASRSR